EIVLYPADNHLRIDVDRRVDAPLGVIGIIEQQAVVRQQQITGFKRVNVGKAVGLSPGRRANVTKRHMRAVEYYFAAVKWSRVAIHINAIGGQRQAAKRQIAPFGVAFSELSKLDGIDFRLGNDPEYAAHDRQSTLSRPLLRC